jgi:hypothetical protein
MSTMAAVTIRSVNGSTPVVSVSRERTVSLWYQLVMRGLRPAPRRAEHDQAHACGSVCVRALEPEHRRCDGLGQANQFDGPDQHQGEGLRAEPTAERDVRRPSGEVLDA